jgi:endonuclease YncB( thermonuclease family)
MVTATVPRGTVAVVDGDMIKVLTAEKQLLRIRLGFIDAPESGQAFGQRARQTMSELVFDRDVELRFHTVERYGRLVCRCFRRWHRRRPGAGQSRTSLGV